MVALSLLPGQRRVAVLGDMLELGPTGPALHHAAGQALAGRVDVVVGVGALAKEIVEGAREAGIPVASLHHFPVGRRRRRRPARASSGRATRCW